MITDPLLGSLTVRNAQLKRSKGSHSMGMLKVKAKVYLTKHASFITFKLHGG